MDILSFIIGMGVGAGLGMIATAWVVMNDLDRRRKNAENPLLQRAAGDTLRRDENGDWNWPQFDHHRAAVEWAEQRDRERAKHE